MRTSSLAAGGDLLMLSAVAFALWKGRLWVRTAALIVGSAWIGVALAQGAHRDAVPWGSAAVDAAAALALIMVAYRSGRRWAVVLAACQALNVSAYLAYGLDHGLLQRAFVTSTYAWSLGVLSALVAGATFESRVQRQTSLGRYRRVRSWRCDRQAGSAKPW